MESRKMALMILLARQQWRCRQREQTYGHGRQGGRRGWDEWRESHGDIYTTVCKIDSHGNLMQDSGNSNQGSVTT